MDICSDFSMEFSAFKVTHAALIASLTAAFVSPASSSEFSDFHFELASDLKGFLGSKAANACSDDEEDQDAAISEAEAWVTDNVSNAGGNDETVALCLWLRGLRAGQEALSELLATQ